MVNLTVKIAKRTKDGIMQIGRGTHSGYSVSKLRRPYNSVVRLAHVAVRRI
jgi:hypothetical protein